MPLRVLFFGTPAFAVPTLDALLASPDAVVVGAVTQPDKPRGRGQQVSASPVKARAESAGLPVLQPTKLADEDFLEAARALAPGPRRGRRLRPAAARGGAGAAAARPDQRPRLAAAAVARRLADRARDHGRRSRDRRHHHARRQGPRRRRDDRRRAHADRSRRDRRSPRGAALGDRRVAARLDAARAARTAPPARCRRTRGSSRWRRASPRPTA